MIGDTTDPMVPVCVRCKNGIAEYDSPDDLCSACWHEWFDEEFEWARTAKPFDIVQWPDTPFDLRKHTILLGRRGSEAHGTYIPPEDPSGIDDRDLMGVVIPPSKYYLGLQSWSHAESIKGQWDVVLYEFKKFIGLIVKQNPNVLGMLWLEPEDYLWMTSAGHFLIKSRMELRARDSAYAAFTGYARAQLKKMTHWKFEGYMGAKRKELVDKFGYDCKNAAHLVRLLHIGEEFMRTGEMKVRRTWDRDMLIAIKQGTWDLERVKAYTDEWFEKCKSAYENSSLPESIDMNRLDECVSAILSGWIMSEPGDA